MQSSLDVEEVASLWRRRRQVILIGLRRDHWHGGIYACNGMRQLHSSSSWAMIQK